MKPTGIVLSLLLASSAAATDFSAALSAAAYAAAQVVAKARPETGPNPLQPSGFPNLPPRDGALPPPRPFGDEEKRFQILHAGKTTRLGSKVQATGGVHAVYQGYDLFGQELEGDLQTEIFELRGDVKVVGLDSIVEGERVEVNFKQRSFNASQADVQLRPSFLQGRVLDDVYVHGATAEGTRREMFGEGSSTTTCNLEHPHFEIISDRTTLRTNRRIILRDSRIKILGKTIIGLPYLSIPLDQRQQRYTPEVGQSPDEGYFVKFKLPVPLKDERNFLDTNLDYYTKLGNGFGGTFDYEGPSSEGVLRAYGILGTVRTIEASIQHLQRIGRSELNVTSNFNRANYLTSPENTMWDNRLSLRVPQATGSTTFNFFRTSNESSSFRYLQQNYSLSDQRRFGRKTNTQLDVSVSKNETSFGGSFSSKREQADVRFKGQHDLDRAMAELEYQRLIPIGQVSNFFTPAQRTPVFSLKSDSRRLFGQKFAFQFPMQAELSMGEFTESGGKIRLNRSHFDLSFARPDDRKSRWGFNFDGRLKQTMYSDDTAQYILGGGVAVRYTLGRDTSINLRHSYLQPHGFTPLSMDRSSRNNLSTGDLSFRPFRSLRIGAQTGYDFLQEQRGQTAWQSLGVVSDWTPASWFSLRSLSTYDPFYKAWSNVRLDLAYRAGATFVGAGARYDGIRHTWGALNLFVDGFKWGRLKTGVLLSYNGYLREFEARHFNFTYDLHCAEAILEILDNPLGFRPGTQVGFYIRLKAFPFNTGFGTGTRGQPIGIGTGRDGF